MFVITFIYLASFYFNLGLNLQCPNKEDVSTFENYLSKFQTRMLPLELDRRTVFDLSKSTDNTENKSNAETTYYEIGQEFIKFIPRGLRDGYPGVHFRCLFELPKFYDFTPVIIASDHFQDDEQDSLGLFLVLYDKSGVCKDFVEVGGFNIDVKEIFSEIKSGDSIIVKNYEFRDPPADKHPDLFYLVEKQVIYHIDKTGLIVGENQESEEGYFRGDWNGYTFVEN